VRALTARACKTTDAVIDGGGLHDETAEAIHTNQARLHLSPNSHTGTP
jgi:hypothetical protein